MFVLIVEHVIEKGQVIGPFNHEEDAKAYAESRLKTYLYRVAPLTPPEK